MKPPQPLEPAGLYFGRVLMSVGWLVIATAGVCAPIILFLPQGGDPWDDAVKGLWFALFGAVLVVVGAVMRYGFQRK
jgi:hypothetical protein